MGLDLKEWKINHRPLLGMHPSNIEAVMPQSEDQKQTSEYAYAYVIGGVKPEDPAYRYYFYTIMINTYLQRAEGSHADVVVFVQMSFESAHDVLPDGDLRLFDAMDIKVQYIPKAEDESFYRIMLDKFLTLSLTQYKRVLFLDGDGKYFPGRYVVTTMVVFPDKPLHQLNTCLQRVVVNVLHFLNDSNSAHYFL